MAALERTDVVASLLKKGFEEGPGDHDYLKLIVGGRYTGIYTKVSRGSKYRTLGDALVGQMARQVKLKKAEFVDLVGCAISGEQYLAILRRQGEEL